jgi:hypothetical protein
MIGRAELTLIRACNAVSAAPAAAAEREGARLREREWGPASFKK